MLKYKILSGVLAAMLIASGGQILLLKSEKLNVGSKLTQTNNNVTTYVTNVDSILNKNKTIIGTLKKNNNTLETENKEANNLNTETGLKNKQLELENSSLKNKIAQLEKENSNLQNEKNSEVEKNTDLTKENQILNNRITNLLDVLAMEKGKSDYKNMSSNQQADILETLLHYWGYGEETSRVIVRLLGIGRGWAAEPIQPNNGAQVKNMGQSNKGKKTDSIVKSKSSIGNNNMDQSNNTVNVSNIRQTTGGEQNKK